MSILNQFNKGKNFEYDNEQKREFIDFKGLVEKFGIDKTYKVDALFINTKGKFGDEPTIVIDDYFVNAPSHMVDVVKSMRGTDELVDMVNENKVGFKIYKYTNQYGEAYACEWVEI